MGVPGSLLRNTNVGRNLVASYDVNIRHDNQPATYRVILLSRA